MNSRALSFVVQPGEIAGETSSTLKAFGVLEVLVRAGRASAGHGVSATTTFAE